MNERKLVTARSVAADAAPTKQPVLSHLFDLRPGPATTHPVAAATTGSPEDSPRRKVYTFASADYPGAAISQVFDSDRTTAAGAFIFDLTGTSRSPDGRFRWRHHSRCWCIFTRRLSGFSRSGNVGPDNMPQAGCQP
jgi:hypothetical protein